MDENSTVSDAPPGGPPPPPSPQRRLERSRHDRWLTGVCGGLGTYFGIDPLIFRIAFIVLTVAGGAGFWLYLAGWLLLPEEGHRRSIIQHTVGHRSLLTIAAIVLIAVGVGSLTSELHFFHEGRIVWALLLIGGGIYLFRTSSKEEEVPLGPSGLPAGAPTPASSTGRGSQPRPWPSEPDSEAGAPPPPVPPAATTTASWPAVPSPAAPRARSITPYILSLLLVGGGLAAFLDAAHVWELSPVPVLAVCVLVTGAALIITAWWGRGRGLIPVGILLALALGMATTADALDLPMRGEVGERMVRPASVDALRPAYRQRMGQLTVDLSRLSFAGGERTVEASLGIGELVVLVPDGVGVDVRARVGMGAIQLFGREDGGGISVRRSRRVAAATPESGTLRVIAATGIGRLEVRRAASLIPPHSDDELEMPDAEA